MRNIAMIRMGLILVAALMTSAYAFAPVSSLPPAELPVLRTVHPDNYKPAQIDCLARNMYFEARSESEAGQLAVAWVTMNRVMSEEYPNNICDVVKQYRQFSWYTGPESTKINWADKTEVAAWRKTSELAAWFIDSFSTLRTDPTKGSLFYHADYVSPYWAKSFVRTAKIGRHIFYRPAK